MRAVGSSALETNLARTAIEVTIPDSQKVLLEITEPMFGVHQETKKLLRELNHEYIGWPQAVEDLHYRAMCDFVHYCHHARAGEAVEVFCALYRRAVEQARPDQTSVTALRCWLYYLEKVAGEDGQRDANLLPPVRDALAWLEAHLRDHPLRAVQISSLVKRLAAVLVRGLDDHSSGGQDAAGEVVGRALGLLAGALDATYTHWLEQRDPAVWYREIVGGEQGPLPRRIAALSHARLEQLRAELRARASEGAGRGQPTRHGVDLLRSPDSAQIEQAYVDAAKDVSAAVQDEPAPDVADGHRARRALALFSRSRWLTRIVGSTALSAVHEPALHAIAQLQEELHSAGDSELLAEFVRQIFGSIRAGGLDQSATALDLVRTVGQAVLRDGDERLCAVLTEQLLELEFAYPEFSGFTAEWSLQVNPAHLRCIRTYLALVEANPRRARRILAALVVHLQIGGVFIADTDLFQKDVSRLLHGDIGHYPVFHHVKHLLRLLPVYFNEIGAEGELRDVTTAIDELGRREDALTHFIRKQCHVECNPQLVPFVEQVARLWAGGERQSLRSYLPAAVYEQLEPDRYAKARRVLQGLVGEEGSVDALFELSAEQLADRLDALERIDDAIDADARRKVELLLRLRGLLASKYHPSHDDLFSRLASFHHIPAPDVEALATAVDGGEHARAAELALAMLEQLKALILDPRQTEAVEDIYHKRHVAVGIPSMYGRYREPKFEAMGLTLRLESLTSSLFERLIPTRSYRYINLHVLREVLDHLRLMLRALHVDGCRGKGPETGLDMLAEALRTPNTSIDQYINVFQYISHSIERLIRLRFIEAYDPLFEPVIGAFVERDADGPAVREAKLQAIERFLRDMIASSFGLQPFDRLVTRVLEALQRQREQLGRRTVRLLMTYDAGDSFVPIGERAGGSVLRLGNKGYMINYLSRAGFPVPPGFILTTELSRCHEAVVGYEPLRWEINERVSEQVAWLERRTGRRLGDPQNPLLLSVRSGAAVSMPGMLDTFLNVGLDAEIAEGLARREKSPWGAWDAYRRFLQLWGMTHGIPRDTYDALMVEAKHAAGVEKKAALPAAQMKELALRYRELILDERLELPGDPFEQLMRCIELVFRSWDAPRARVYRRELQIADDWGTAVSVQSMVFGNLSERSGTGVVMSANSHHSPDGVLLYGDFIIQGQGEDVVSGLVSTYPISEQQRLSEADDRVTSLQKDFPAIYQRLRAQTLSLLFEHEMHHQEIEFTFESAEAEDLYLLQTRDAVAPGAGGRATEIFIASGELEAARVGSGIGVCGGAISGRVAHRAEEISSMRRRYPDDPVILLRPDTVPEDVGLIIEADAVLTAVGGATSHAAVVAQRLGRTCVVGCRSLEVHEASAQSLLADRPIRSGDLLSIDGEDGSIYLGRHPTRVVVRRGLA